MSSFITSKLFTTQKVHFISTPSAWTKRTASIAFSLVSEALWAHWIVYRCLAMGDYSPVAVRLYLWIRLLPKLFLKADDEALRIWDIYGKRHLQTLEDRSRRWGQITCLKWLSINPIEGNRALCFGTGRGLLLIYQRLEGKVLVSTDLWEFW